MTKQSHFPSQGRLVDAGSQPFRSGAWGLAPKKVSTALTPDFFERDAQVVACDLLGKVLAHRVDGLWLAARIIEAEAYHGWDKASHAHLGFTESRRSLFMAPGTLYLYYARGGDSFNLSCGGEGDAVLVKAGIPWLEDGFREDGSWGGGLPEAGEAPQQLECMHRLELGQRLERMHQLNPLPSGKRRADHKLCAGQTLLCRALGIKVPRWDGQMLGADDQLCILEAGAPPSAIVRTTRLGIPQGRDGHLPFRFVDADHALSATRNPLTRNAVRGVDYQMLDVPVNVATLLADLRPRD